MKDKEKQIEEMVVELNTAADSNIKLVRRAYLTLEAEAKYCGMGVDFNAVGFAEALYNAGYRKEKETAREILQKSDEINKGGQNDLCELEVWIKEQYGVEVEDE